MDFGLSEEQDLLQETVRQFARNECPPARQREIFDAGVGHDPELWRELSQLGLCGLLVPASHGGVDGGVLDLALVCEELGYAGVPGPFMLHALAGLAIAQAGDGTQRDRWLPGLADGSRVATLAVGENVEGWAPGQWSCRVEQGKLSGHKRFVAHAHLADLILVGLEDGNLAVVEAGASGLVMQSEEGIDRGRPICRLNFDRVACEVLAGGAAQAERIIDVGLVLLAADSFGAASRLVDVAVDYAKTRDQFGRKIAEFQAVKHQLARLGLEIEPTRALFWSAAHAMDSFVEDASRLAAEAKAHITDRSMDTARAVVELHGGVGFTWECDVQMWFKRIMFDRALFGGPECLRERCAVLGGL